MIKFSATHGPFYHRLIPCGVDTIRTFDIQIGSISRPFFKSSAKLKPQHVSEKHRTGFPVFGHPRYWLINTLQKLVLRNHGVHLYPEFPNMSEYGSTQERNGTIPLHSLELGAAVDNIVLPLAPPGKPYKLSPDKKYLCKMTKTKWPFVPVVHKEEKMLFNRMLLGMEGTPDFDKMAIDWCTHVDGVNIFPIPKLPVYLRRYFSNYLHSVANAAPGEVKLRQLNEQFGVEALLRERNTNPTLYLMPTVTMPPTISQIPDTQLLPEGRVAVAGTIIGGAQSTRGFENHPIRKRGTYLLFLLLLNTANNDLMF